MAASEQCCKPMFWDYLLICACLVLFAGLMSGLTLGPMSLSLVDLKVLTKAGQPQDRKNAAKILLVIKNQHLLLCTLLIGNSLAMEMWPDLISKSKEGGADLIQTYAFWNGHEPIQRIRRYCVKEFI